jgi:hypothetical protein
MPGGLGDWSAQHVAADILKKALPNLRLELVTLVDETEKRLLFYRDAKTHLIPCRGKEPLSIPPHIAKKLDEASLILQIPTVHPHFTKGYHIGEYGFIDSEHFHPETNNLCMGLHALEKGLLLYTDLLPTDLIKTTPYYFAYLITKRGYATYLHTLLAATKTDLKLIVCNFLPLLEVLKEEEWSGYDLKEIRLRDAAHETRIAIAESGRTLTIECHQNLSSRDVQKLILGAEPFVGCRGDRSFSEVISLERPFFYDPLEHSRPFLHDLVDASKYHCLAYPTLTTYLESLLDRGTPPRLLGKILAEMIFDPAFKCGMQKLISILKTDYLFNPNLVNFVKSKILGDDESRFQQFLQGAHSLEELIYGRN